MYNIRIKNKSTKDEKKGHSGTHQHSTKTGQIICGNIYKQSCAGKSTGAGSSSVEEREKRSYCLLGFDYQDGGLTGGELSTDEQVCAFGDHHWAEGHAGDDGAELGGEDFDHVLTSRQGS